MARPLLLHRFELLDYESAWHWQREAAASVRAGGREALALLQHPPVYTLGRRIRPEHLLVPPGALRDRGAGVVETDRGGDVTFHGPGQLVGYPILNLRDRGLGPAAYVRLLEDTLITVLGHFGLEGWRVPGRPGVWTSRGKIGAIGVRIQGGVSTHGFALNVDPDLAWFDAIVPCGLNGISVTSMQEHLGGGHGVPAVARAVAEELASLLDARLVAVTTSAPA